MSQAVHPFTTKSEAMAQAIIDYGSDYATKGDLKLRLGRWVFKPTSEISVPDVVIESHVKKQDREKMATLPMLETSTCKSPCRTVWELADSMLDGSKSDVIIASIEAGVATATAKTQYSRWKKARNE